MSLHLCPQALLRVPLAPGLSHSAPLPHACSPIYPSHSSHFRSCSRTSPHVLALAFFSLPHTAPFASAPTFPCTRTRSHSNACALARSYTSSCVRYPFSSYWDPKTWTQPPKRPPCGPHYLRAPSPPRDQCALHKPPYYEHGHGHRDTPSPSQDCLLLGRSPPPVSAPQPFPTLRIAPATVATATSSLSVLSCQGPPEPASPVLGASCPGSLGASEDRRTGFCEGGWASLLCVPQNLFQSSPGRKLVLGGSTATSRAFSEPPEGIACVPQFSNHQVKTEKAA